VLTGHALAEEEGAEDAREEDAAAALDRCHIHRRDPRERLHSKRIK